MPFCMPSKICYLTWALLEFWYLFSDHYLMQWFVLLFFNIAKADGMNTGNVGLSNLAHGLNRIICIVVVLRLLTPLQVNLSPVI